MGVNVIKKAFDMGATKGIERMIKYMLDLDSEACVKPRKR